MRDCSKSLSTMAVSVAGSLSFGAIAIAMILVATQVRAVPVSFGTLPTRGVPAGAPGDDPAFLFTFTSIDLTTVIISGSLNANDNGNGTFNAISGTINFSGTHFVSTGTGTLIPNGSSPTQITSPSGYFFYDNQLLPSANPLILNGGLLFAGGPNAGPNPEINIFSNGAGPGTYQYYDNNGGTFLGDFTLTPVVSAGVAPLPKTATLGFGMLASLGLMFGLKQKFKSQVAA